MMTVAIIEEQQLEQRFERYKEQYGYGVYWLACYAAFPLTLTSDLVYCLRENFLPKFDWYTAPTFLMSGVLTSLRHDLYELDAPIRRYLLKQFRQGCGDRFHAELQMLDDFMTSYVSYHLQSPSSSQAVARLMGRGEEMRWVALSCISPGETLNAIRDYLAQLAGTEDAKERVRLASLLDSYVDLFGDEAFSGKLIRWADCVADGEPIPSDNSIEDWLKSQGISLEELKFNAIELVSESELDSNSTDELKTLTFQTIKVNDAGEIIDRPECSVQYFDEVIGDGMSIRMIAIPSGEFMMGSPDGEGDSDEYPQHHVQVPPFFMSETPVTKKQWRTIVDQYAAIASTDLKPTPSGSKGDERPVEQVSWDDVSEFCQVISTVTRRTGYRLPTEAEWEYACRAGSMTDYAFGNKLTKKMAHFNQSSTANVKKNRKPNAFGLFDMHGTVWEWCEDTWHKNYKEAPSDGSAWIGNDEMRIVRGGSWFLNPWYCRSAYRPRRNPGVRLNDVGFRLVLSLPRNS